MEELHETEKGYVGTLETINKVFRPALSGSGKVCRYDFTAECVHFSLVPFVV